MKKLALNVAKALFVIVLFTTVSVTLSASGVNTVSEAKAAVPYDVVNDYLVNLDYTVVNLREVQGSENWIAHTILNGQHFQTTIFVKGCEIITHEDVTL